MGNNTFYLCSMYLNRNLKKYSDGSDEMEKFKEDALGKFDLFLLTNRIDQNEYKELCKQLGMSDFDDAGGAEIEN